MSVSKRRRRKQADHGSADFAPLTWLADFANIGIDGTQPYGPVDRLMQSRFLGLDATHRGYAMVPGGKTITDEGWGVEIITQEYRGVRKRWTRRPSDWDSAPEPFPYGVPSIPSYEALQQHFETRQRIRSIMPIHADGLHWWLPNSEGPVTNEIILQRFGEVQSTTRLFLEMVWYARRGAGPATGRMTDAGIARSVTACEEIVVTYVCAVTNACCRPAPCPPPPRPAAAPDDFTQWFLTMAELVFKTVWKNRARVWPGPMQQGGTTLPFVSDGFPGIIWAEILNVVTAKPVWPSLRMCGWCGRFAINEQTGPGRPREFCSNGCCDRFHDYAPQDRRE